MALLWEDFIKLRNASVGDTVELSDGEVVKKKPNTPVHITKPTKNMNLDFYERSRNY